VDQWYELLARGLKMEELVVQQRASMDAYDPGHQIGLIVDEWGTWHPVEEGTEPRWLYQQNTIRDALVAATTLDIFNRHADKVVMSNIAQTVNVLQAVVLTRDDQMVVTPTGHVYEMYAPHQGGTSVRSLVEVESLTFATGEGEGSIPALAASASLRGKTLFVTLTNSHATAEVPADIRLIGGATAGCGKARVLSGEIHAHNTFADPAAVKPRDYPVDATGTSFAVRLPPASVVAIEVGLQ
jgi:alpha-N-arabinofuranosidase